MKTLMIGIAAIAITTSACNSNGTQSNTTDDSTSNSTTAMQPLNNTSVKGDATTSNIVNGYLQVKNALANDNGSDAANGGKAIVNAMATIDKSSLSAQQSKAYDDVADDMKENAEHISENAGKIDHQREHFSMLSQDMYDFVKAFGSEQKLYKDSCPMYDNGKGAVWLSETKDIKNPYLGKEMPTCGSVKEEIHQQ